MLIQCAECCIFEHVMYKRRIHHSWRHFHQKEECKSVYERQLEGIVFIFLLSSGTLQTTRSEEVSQNMITGLKFLFVLYFFLFCSSNRWLYLLDLSTKVRCQTKSFYVGWPCPWQKLSSHRTHCYTVVNITPYSPLLVLWRRCCRWVGILWTKRFLPSKMRRTDTSLWSRNQRQNIYFTINI